MKRICLGLLLALLIAGGLSACKKSSGGAGASTGPILIGHFASMSGSEANFGIFTDNGAKLAIAQRNAKGGVKGRQVELKTYDDEGKAANATTVVTKLVTSDKVTAVLGEVASTLSIAGAQVCQPRQVPMVSPSSTNPAVTGIGDMIFRVCFIDPFQGDVCAKFAIDKNWKSAAILFDRTAAYSTGLEKNFTEAFTKAGGTVVESQAFSKGDNDFSAQLNAILAKKPDVLFIPAYYTDVGNIAIQLRRLNPSLPMLGSDGWTGVHNVSPEVARAMEGSFYSDHYSAEDPSPSVQTFLKEYQDKYGNAPDSMAALGYDAANILMDAMEKAPSLSGADIAAELAKTKDFKGVTGAITIDEQRNARKPAVILQITNGQTKFMTTVAP
jgi:branched-chain amino acid transport system substrate-binding protein